MTRGLLTGLLTTLLTTLLLAGCSGSDAGTSAVCEPGKTESCACPGMGDVGAQTCDGDGKGWGACECAPGDGAAGSHGGSQSGSAGSMDVAGAAAAWTPGDSSSTAPAWNDATGNTGCKIFSLIASVTIDIYCAGRGDATWTGDCGAPCVKGEKGANWCCPAPRY